MDDTVYLPRPPRRQLTLITIGLFTAAQWVTPGERFTGLGLRAHPCRLAGRAARLR